MILFFFLRMQDEKTKVLKYFLDINKDPKL